MLFSGEQTSNWTYQSEAGDVTLVGQCVAPRQEFETVAQVALRTGSLTELQTLAGGYSIVAQRGDTCTVEADPSGQFPIYWQESEDRPRLSTKGSDLGSTPDKAFLAAAIADCRFLVLGRSALCGVQYMEGGMTGHFTSGKLTALQEAATTVTTATLEEGVTALRTALSEAVTLRLDLGKVVTSDCSGGFDSSTLTLLLAQKNPRGVDAFFQYMPGTISGDRRFARFIAEGNPRLRLHESAQTAEMLPFLQLERCILPDEPSSWTAINARARAHLSQAAAHGGEIHLTGDGGDAILDASPYYTIADLARRGEYERLKIFCQSYGRVQNVDPARYLAHAMNAANRTQADDLQRLARYLASPEAPADDANKLTWFTVSKKDISFLTDAMRRELSERAEEQAIIRSAHPSVRATEFDPLRGLRVNGIAQRHLRFLAHSVGIDVHTPYMDRNVVRACQQVPADVRTQPGEFKRLLRDAFSDLLPDELKRRQTKGTYTNESYRGLRAARKTILGLFSEDCRLADLGIIEPSAVLQEIRRLDMALQGSFPTLERIVATEVWLRHLEEASDERI